MRNSKRIKIVAGGTAALFGVGVAFAAWTSTGTGNGSVTARGAQSLGVAQDAPVSGLFPTDTKTIDITVTNPNPYGIEISSLSPGTVVVSGGGAGCTAASSLVTFEDLTGLSDYVAAGESETYTLDVSMGADSHNDCQLATFTAPYTATAASANAPAAQ